MKKNIKIAMIGAGSAFSLQVAESLGHEVFHGSTLMLMDINEKNLQRAHDAIETRLKEKNIPVVVQSSTSMEKTLEGCNYVILSAELNRWPNWLKDLEIPQRHGVHQFTGENGGPGGQIHAMRNMGMFMPIVEAMGRLCPEAWLLNFTNPMSPLCTYLIKHTRIKSSGFCHQVHGSFGVIAEQLGFEPGELQVVSAGINHLNWLFDLRRRSTGESYLKEFLERIQSSQWWLEVHKNIPEQVFTLEIYKTFGMYPVGYDGHIGEYFSCFYGKDEWEKLGLDSQVTRLKKMIQNKVSTMEMTIKSRAGERPFPFPQDPAHPYYLEMTAAVIRALETNEPCYLDANVGLNQGAVPNLPADAILDRPAVVVGGQIRSVYVGELPAGPAEICRRQIAIHEMIVRAVVEGDHSLAIQALCLDPFVGSITQARNIWKDFYQEYRENLKTFKS